MLADKKKRENENKSKYFVIWVLFFKKIYRLQIFLGPFTGFVGKKPPKTDEKISKYTGNKRKYTGFFKNPKYTGNIRKYTEIYGAYIPPRVSVEKG